MKTANKIIKAIDTFVVVLVESGIPADVYIRHTRFAARDKARSIVQDQSYNNEDDCVQVFDMSIDGGSNQLSNAEIDKWIAERSSKDSSTK